MVRAFHVEVTDHAVVRWLERVQGVDVGAIRRDIANQCEPAIAIGATGIKIQGAKFVIHGNVVCTILKTTQFQHATSQITDRRSSRSSTKQKWMRGME